jgi:anti-sigma B factor antagonist
MAALDVRIEQDGSRAALHLSGEFDMGGELDFEAKLDRLLEAGPDTVVLDLRALTFLDSTGLRALLRARERGRREGWQLALTPVQPTVERVFELTRTKRLFRIVEDGRRSVAGEQWDPPRTFERPGPS